MNKTRGGYLFYIMCMLSKSRPKSRPIISLCLDFTGTLLADLSELWIRTQKENILPVHEIARTMGPKQCMALPFIHSLCGHIILPVIHSSQVTGMGKSKKVDIDTL